MKKLNYKICTIDPIIISSESGNQFMVPTKDYIPGVNILGVLAALHLKSKGADKTFYDYFVNGKVNYSNAYKVDLFDKKEYLTYPLPLSIQHIKNNESIIIDLLYSNSDDQTKPFNGYGCLENNRLLKTVISKSTDPHHQRDYKTGSAKSGVFFNYESIDSNQTFEGTIWGEDSQIDGFYKSFSAVNEIRIGRSRSTEYGKIELTFSEPLVPSENPVQLNSDETVSLTFLSNVILYNGNGVSTGMFEYLENLLKTEISENIEIKKAFLRTEEIENYVSVWKLKKPSEISFKAGSCLLLKVNKEDVGKLMKLQSEGIGERRNEGFGQIVFGLQQSEGYYEKLAAEKIIAARPEKESPLLVKTMALSLAEEYLQKVVTVIALNLVKENTKGLDKKISSSQIGRMEGIVRVSNSYSGFVSKINGLRKTSKDKLTSCRFDKSNLLLFLTEVRFLDQIQIKNALLVVDSLFDQVGIDKSKSTSIQEKLFKWYYLTLFSAMRKAIKKEGKNNE